MRLRVVPRSEVPAGDRVSRGKVHCPATNAARCDSHLVPHRSIEQDMVSLVKYIVGAQHSEPNLMKSNFAESAGELSFFPDPESGKLVREFQEFANQLF